MSLLRPRPVPAAAAVPDRDALEQLRDGLRGLHEHCLTDLVGGLGAVARGDLTRMVAPRTTPITDGAQDPLVGELVGLFNAMLDTTQAALLAYEDVRAELRSALGDRS